MVEDYDETYYQPFREFEREARKLTNGHTHLHEAQLKAHRPTPGEPGHEATPADVPG